MIIKDLVLKTGKAKVEIIEQALESFRYHEKMRLLNEQYECLRLDKKVWSQELQERHELEGTLMDGLDDE